MPTPVFVLGGAQSDFARRLDRDGRGLVELAGEVVDAALADAGVDVTDVGVIHVGNAFGELFAGQAQLGAAPATARPALWGVPAARHEAACASGSIAVLAAMADLEAERYDVALVVGLEQERNVTGEVAARHMGTAALAGESPDARFLWPHQFARIGDAYAERWGLDRRHLVAISRKNLGNARANPYAQTRGWTIDDAALADDDTVNPRVEGRLRRHDCSQVTDGGVALVLAGRRFAETWAARHRGARSLDRLARITGWGHRTAALPLEPKLARSAAAGPGALVMPHVADAFADACRRAGVARDQLAGLEAHDCFTTTEYLAIDHVGLTAPGASWQAIEDGRTERGGAFPINPSGGLIGGGHPVGATGVRMVLDAARQVTATAGDTQVAIPAAGAAAGAGARAFATLNLGGSATTVVSFIVSA